MILIKVEYIIHIKQDGKAGLEEGAEDSEVDGEEGEVQLITLLKEGNQELDSGKEEEEDRQYVQH